MSTLLLGLGVALAIEGLFYAAFPRSMQAMMRLALELPETTLRSFGLAALSLGVVLVWLLRG